MTRNFVCIIGAQRSGTTFLYHALSNHPHVQMAKPERPEPKFFLNDSEFSRGRDYYIQKYFPGAAATITIGEKGTSYMEYSFIADRIRSYFADARIIAVLRNPVTRALSNYFFSKQNGLETRRIEEVFWGNVCPPKVPIEVSVSPFAYIERGRYYNYLPAYINAFGKNVKIVIMEELMTNVKTELAKLFDMVGVSASIVHDSSYTKINSVDVDYSEEVPSDIVRKLKSIYREDIVRIERMLGRKIEHWHD